MPGGGGGGGSGTCGDEDGDEAGSTGVVGCADEFPGWKISFWAPSRKWYRSV